MNIIKSPTRDVNSPEFIIDKIIRSLLSCKLECLDYHFHFFLMLKFSLLTFILFYVQFCFGQAPIKDYVISQAKQISSIDPSDEDYSDLHAIGDAIGKSRIVMLGEQDHGDAPTFLAKTRLIKYLHEKLGFNILAFESDFFGLNFGFDKLEKSKPKIDTFLRKNIFPIWTNCHTCQNLFYNYIPSTFQTDNPLLISGFDNQMVLNFSSKQLSYYLDSLLQSLNIFLTKQQNYRTEILPLIDSLKYYSFKDIANYAKCETFLNQIKNQISGKLNESDFWMMVINNLIAENKTYMVYKIDKIIASNIRDEQMALNLKWLMNIKFPNERIIVWAANAHVAKYMDSLGKSGRKLISMGSFFTNTKRYFDETYVLGFTSYEGEAGRLGFDIYSVRKPKTNGFENWINKSYNYSFVDFKNYNSKYPDQPQLFYLKGLGHNTAFQKDWTKVFDGIFFIREMYPCKR